MYLWWLPYLAAPAMLLTSLALLGVSAVLLTNRRRNAAPDADPAPAEAPATSDPPKPAPRPTPAKAWRFLTAWRSLKEWASVVAVYLGLLAIMVSGLFLANNLMQQARDSIVREVGITAANAVSEFEDFTEQSTIRINSANVNLALLTQKMDALSNDFNEVWRRVEYLNGRVEGNGQPEELPRVGSQAPTEGSGHSGI